MTYLPLWIVKSFVLFALKVLYCVTDDICNEVQHSILILLNTKLGVWVFSLATIIYFEATTVYSTTASPILFLAHTGMTVSNIWLWFNEEILLLSPPKVSRQVTPVTLSHKNHKTWLKSQQLQYITVFFRKAGTTRKVKFFQ